MIKPKLIIHLYNSKRELDKECEEKKRKIEEDYLWKKQDIDENIAILNSIDEFAIYAIDENLEEQWKLIRMSPCQSYDYDAYGSNKHISFDIWASANGQRGEIMIDPYACADMRPVEKRELPLFVSGYVSQELSDLLKEMEPSDAE